MMDEIKNKIDADNEVLDILPQNNLRNKKKYLEKVQELIKEYQYKQNEIYKYITSKNSLLKNVSPNPNIEGVKNRITDLYEKVLYFNKYQTAYEILGLDKLFYNLHKYYNNDLYYYNDNINKIIDIYEKAGVSLTSDDFFFSESANQYMAVLLEERKKGNYNSDLVKTTFERLFWASHHMMRHILLNFKHIYYQNEKKFNEYLLKTQKEILEGFDNSYDVLLKEYQNMIVSYDNLLDESKYLYYEKFMNKDLAVKDYLPDKMEKLISNYIENTATTNKDLFIKFYNSLKEEKFIRDYEFILEDINKLYSEKDSYKNIVSTTMKEISGKEKDILKKRKKIKRAIKWHRTGKVEILNNEIETILTELDQSYDLLDENKNKELIGSIPKPSIKDYFEIAKSYLYLIACMKRNEKEDIDILKLIDELEEIILSPYNILIDNITYDDLKNLNFIIYDKFRLLGLNLSVDDFDTENLENFISTIKSIITFYNLSELKINVMEIDFIMKSDEIIKNRNV